MYGEGHDGSQPCMGRVMREIGVPSLAISPVILHSRPPPLGPSPLHRRHSNPPHHPCSHRFHLYCCSPPPLLLIAAPKSLPLLWSRSWSLTSLLPPLMPLLLFLLVRRRPTKQLQAWAALPRASATYSDTSSSSSIAACPHFSGLHRIHLGVGSNDFAALALQQQHVIYYLKSVDWRKTCELWS